MSKENLDQFIQQISDSEELQTRIGEEIDADSLIALGAEHGCEFTADDLTAGAELSDEELDGVAGGAAYIKDAGIGRRGSKFRIGRKKTPNQLGADDCT
jgi:predicted ribosomally synthesized peptide with nif11-like leader